MTNNKLNQLKQFTTVVADTGDFDAIAKLKPIDATTNPSLLFKSASMPRYASIVQQIRQQHPTDAKQAALQYAVAVGKQILPLIPGRISTEVDVHLSFDEQATYDNALKIIDSYNAAGIGSERILIKIAATWEGIKAAKRLEQAGIQTNLTLLFSFAQAAACADAGVYLISPFVGRIYDWYKKANNCDYVGSDDPGVQSVKRIYRYYKQNNYQTVVMGASFRNTSQIEQLAGCDRLTISPELMQQLAQQTGELPQQLNPKQAGEEICKLNQADFRWQHNSDAMATSKLAEGLRLFAKDQQNLEQLFS